MKIINTYGKKEKVRKIQVQTLKNSGEKIVIFGEKQ